MIYNQNNPQIARRHELLKLLEYGENLTSQEKMRYSIELAKIESNSAGAGVSEIKGIETTKVEIEQKVKTMAKERLKDVVEAKMQDVRDAFATAYGDNTKAKLQATLKLTAEFRAAKKPSTPTN